MLFLTNSQVQIGATTAVPGFRALVRIKLSPKRKLCLLPRVIPSVNPCFFVSRMLELVQNFADLAADVGDRRHAVHRFQQPMSIIEADQRRRFAIVGNQARF